MDTIAPPHIGFQTFQVGEDYRIFKYVREDGEFFFLKLQVDFPGLTLTWANDDSVKPGKEVVLYRVHRDIGPHEAEAIKIIVRDFDPIEINRDADRRTKDS